MTTQNSLDAYLGVRALVLGASGFIGRRVVRTLAAVGADVIACGRDRAALDVLQRCENGRIETAFCDVVQGDDLERLIADVAPDITFNLAGYGIDRAERDERLAQLINAELPPRIGRTIAAGRPSDVWDGAALVHAGSALEYGQAAGDLREETAPHPTTLYGRSKLAGAEALARVSVAAGLKTLTARLFTVYGPGEQGGRLLPVLIEAARSRSPVDLTAGLQRRDFTFVDDAAEGLLRLAAASAEPGTLVNLATGRLTTVRSFAETAADVLGLERSLLRFGTLPTREEEMSHEPVAVDRLRALTGWLPPTSIAEGVRRTHAESMRPPDERRPNGAPGAA